jgi:hypothetical protein
VAELGAGGGQQRRDRIEFLFRVQPVHQPRVVGAAHRQTYRATWLPAGVGQRGYLTGCTYLGKTTGGGRFAGQAVGGHQLPQRGKIRIIVGADRDPALATRARQQVVIRVSSTCF